MSKSVKNNPKKKKKMKKEMDKDISNIFHISVCRHVNKSSLILKV